MTVYVDPAIHPWRGKKWCHLTADSLAELHLFAARLRLKRSWFQDHRFMPHYDLTENKRSQAIELGAEPITATESGRRVRARRIALRATPCPK